MTTPAVAEPVPSVIGPFQELLPEALSRAPALLLPGPFTRSGSLTVPAPVRSCRVEFVPMVVPTEVEPSAFGSDMARMPESELTVMPPRYPELSAERVKVPAPSLVRLDDELPLRWPE